MELDNIKTTTIDIQSAFLGKNPENTKHDDTKGYEDNNISVNKENEINQEQEVKSINDDDVLSYLKSKGKDVNSIDDLFSEKEKVKEIIKEINPYEDVLDEDDKEYLEFKRNTGKGRKEFEETKIDDNDIVKIARRKLREETKLDLTDEEIDEYLNDNLGIDIEDLNVSDKIKLSEYVKDYRDKLKSETQKKNDSKTDKAENNLDTQNYLKLENGTFILKSDYEDLVAKHQKYIETNKDVVNSVTKSTFSIEIDETGDKRTLEYEYEYTDEDKHSMLSMTSDTSKFVDSTYLNENGFDQKRFNEDMFWLSPKNRSKAIATLLQKARAEAIEDFMKDRGNVNLQPRQSLHNQENKGFKIVSIKDAFSGNI